MTKEHKKLYKAGKNWIVATLTATTITLLGGIGAYTVHADTTIESSQDVQTTSVNQTNQVDNSNDSVTINQPVTTQSNSTVKNSQPVQNTPTTETAFAATNSSDGLDPSIYGTVNVRNWYYQKDNNLIILTGYRTGYGAGYRGQDNGHIIVPNLNDFNNVGVKIGNAAGVGISSILAKKLASQSMTFAISKTSGNYNNKVIATDQNWSGVFSQTALQNWSGVFSETPLINIDVSNLDTRNITNMSGLFAGSYALKTVGDLSQWNTSNVTNMSYLFSMSDNYQLNNVGDLGKWDTRSVTDMSGMFSGSIIVPGNIGNWNVSNVKDMSEMFDSNHGGGHW